MEINFNTYERQVKLSEITTKLIARYETRDMLTKAINALIDTVGITDISKLTTTFEAIDEQTKKLEQEANNLLARGKL